MKPSLRIACALTIAAACTLPAAAQHRQAAAPAHPAPIGAGPVHLDQRYGHDHYYPAPGFSVRTLPSRSVSVPHGTANWFYHGGVWYRPRGGRFVVDVPPFGVVVPFLPPAYISLWIDGSPYFYANGTYYESANDGYVVVAPPPGAELAQPTPPTFFIYARNGQSSQQTDSDRAACNDWASAQPATANDPAAFERAFAACMDGRGYTVR